MFVAELQRLVKKSGPTTYILSSSFLFPFLQSSTFNLHRSPLLLPFSTNYTSMVHTTLPPAPSPRPPTTIHSLPPELLTTTLDLMYENSLTKHQRALRRCSLVCRKWTDIAQALRWKRIELGGRPKIDRLLESPKVGSYTTKSLTVVPRSTPLTRYDAMEVVNAVKGVKHLGMLGFDFNKVTFFNHLNLDFIHIPGLSGMCKVFGMSFQEGLSDVSLVNLGLTSLCLVLTAMDFDTATGEQGETQATFAHSLRRLALEDYSSNSSSLYTIFQSTTLTHLSIRHTVPYQTSAFHDFFHIIAHQLVHLGIHLVDQKLPLVSFKLCVNLSSLEIACPADVLTAVIRALPSSGVFRTLTLHPPNFNMETLDLIVTAMNQNIQEVSLKSLVAQGWVTILKKRGVATVDDTGESFFAWSVGEKGSEG